jgi:hypothetical protein
MMPNSRFPAQVIVILGFVVTAAASVIGYFDNVTSRGYYFNGFRVIVIPLLNPLIMIAALFAWWWLTRLEESERGQRTNLRLAYIAFAIQYLLTSILYLMIIWPIRSLGGFWVTSTFWFQLVGAFVSAIGLFLLSGTLSSRTESIAAVRSRMDSVRRSCSGAR